MGVALQVIQVGAAFTDGVMFPDERGVVSRRAERDVEVARRCQEVGRQPRLFCEERASGEEGAESTNHVV